jgi:L-threonylcarbamoyladenylate synthase
VSATARILRVDAAADGATLTAALADAAAVLAAGGIVAYPTETVYGLAADPTRDDAVAAIFAAKGRSGGEALPLIATDVAAAARVAAAWSDTLARLAEAFWPGPLTLIVALRPGAVAAGVSAGRSTVAVRVSSHPIARALAACAPSGLITATSANRSGSPSLSTAADVVAALGPVVPIVVDAGRAPGGLASTIVDISAGPPRLIRPGPVAFDRVLESLDS